MRVDRWLTMTLVVGRCFLGCVKDEFDWNDPDASADPGRNVNSDSDADSDTDGDSDTDSDTASDSDTDTDADSDIGESDTGVALCCENDEGNERPWCDGEPQIPGKGCDNVSIIGRSNFSSDNQATFKKVINTFGLQNNFESVCKDSRDSTSADAWFAVFAFEGEMLIVELDILTVSAPGNAHIYLIAPITNDFCGPHRQVDCRRFALSINNRIKHAVTETGWYIMILDAVNPVVWGARLIVGIDKCAVQQDCSCWPASDDPGPDVGPVGNTDSDTNIDAGAADSGDK